MKTKHRVHYYSNTDLSIGPNLKLAQEVLNAIKPAQEFDINDCIELFEIKKLFDNNQFLPSWNETEISQYKYRLQKYWPTTQQLFRSINSTNITQKLSTLESGYIHSFWHLFSYFQTFKQIDEEIFGSLLKGSPHYIYHILENEKLVKHYSKEIRTFLLSYEEAAELLIRNTEISDTSYKYHFPKSLTLEDKETLIAKYVESDDPNPNYLSLIAQSKNTKDFKLSARVRLNTKRKEQAVTAEILKKNSLSMGVEVALDKQQIEPVKFSSEDHVLRASYSKQLLDTITDYTELFDLFHQLFLLVDQNGAISLVSKDNEQGVFERIGLHSKNAYPTSITYQRKNFLSFIQITIFEKYLQDRKLSIETLASHYIIEHFKNDFKTARFHVDFPLSVLRPIEKIRTLAPELESLLRQYKQYIEEGEIDFDLLRFSSSPLNFSNVPSLLDKKYVYPKGDLFKTFQRYFFSDQSLLNHTTSNHKRYESFYDLITNEELTKADLSQYQTDIIEHFIKEKHLYIDSKGRIKVNNPVMFSIIDTYHKQEYLSYWHCTEEQRIEIDQMITSGQLSSSDKLFTKQEISYLNYYLNQKEFTNGLDLRNKYLHGTNITSEKENEQEYTILLRLIILVTLKIEYDLRLSEYVYVYQLKKQQSSAR